MTDAKAATTVSIETYGCQMNVLDTELVTGQLEALGYRLVEGAEEAEVVLINTCSVRDLSEQKVWSRLGRLGIAKRERGGMIIGVLGCMAEREGAAILKRMPHVDLVCGPSNLDRLPTLLDNLRRQPGQQSLLGHTARRHRQIDPDQDSVEALDLSRGRQAGAKPFQAYVRITRGCNKFCAFCVVPYTRGPEVHRPPDHIIEEIQRLVDGGVHEVTLIGQTVNHYEYRAGGRTTAFADLLWQIHEAVPNLPRLRFVTSYPRDFSDAALDVMASCPRICRYLHIPVQSGSDAMLRAMNRGYTVASYLSLVERARARMPDICLSGDMIVGFPGETTQDHQASVALLQQVRYKSCFVFKYSPRSGTVAARRFRDDIPEELKKERNLELLALQSDISLAHHQLKIGKTVDVLVESRNKLRQHPQPPAGGVKVAWQERLNAWQARLEQNAWVRLVGRTGGDEIVAFDGPGELVGKITRVRALHATALTLLGEWVVPEARLDINTPRSYLCAES